VITRRELLGAAALSALSGCDPSRPKAGVLGLMERVNERLQVALFDPSRLAEELPASAATPERDFPSYHISPGVPLAPQGWVLQVGGLVGRPLTLTLDDLRRLPRTDLRVRHHCVEGWSAVSAWHGVRVSEIARLAAADPRATCVDFGSFDEGYHSSWDLASALHPQTILAYGKNGEPLSPDFGAPLRLYGAVKLGYKMVKYLTRVDFLPHRNGGYWEDQGYEWFAGV
jgi:DMSO/TMAO reductase YedYZ molybdopterin-dependent catalytic subunit